MVKAGLVIVAVALAAVGAAAAPQKVLTGKVQGHIGAAEAEAVDMEGFLRWFDEAHGIEGRDYDFDRAMNYALTCAGWTAQMMCGGVFGGGIPEEIVAFEDIAGLGLISAEYEIDYDEMTVTGLCTLTPGDVPENVTLKTIWRDGLGCTTVEGITEEELRAQDVGNQTPPPPLDPSVPWPEGNGYFPEGSPAGVDRECLAAAVQKDFDTDVTNTRAISVSYKGYLVFEQYADNITADTRLLGWSATKSLTQSLIGIATMENPAFDIYGPAPVPEWYEDPDDGRQEITVDMMLRMSSGTRWIGDIGPTTECLFFSEGDCAYTSSQQPLTDEPDTRYNYNSGSSYILSRIALEQRGDDATNNWEWPKEKLFWPIGMYNSYIEYQQNGVFLGGAYGYAPSREWLRFGLLHARDGVWVDGTRVLPEGWAEYSRTPTHTNPTGYAAHFWKNPAIDPELYVASGFRNQNVFIFPDQDIVIARNAMPPPTGHFAFAETEFLRDMTACFDEDFPGNSQ